MKTIKHLKQLNSVFSFIEHTDANSECGKSTGESTPRVTNMSFRATMKYNTNGYQLATKRLKSGESHSTPVNYIDDSFWDTVERNPKDWKRFADLLFSFDDEYPQIQPRNVKRLKTGVSQFRSNPNINEPWTRPPDQSTCYGHTHR
mmetsp:Transcript_13713/g.16674  ORF Transcript_13713/g.16674 Transcript_13713/m.16674 type:complete len:146 (+) Transcript_13713:322-759(+)